MTQERKSVFQFCCLKRCSEDSTAFVRVAFLCEWLKGSKSCSPRPTSEHCPPSGEPAQPLLLATEWCPGEYSSPWQRCERACRAQQGQGSHCDPRLCPGNVLIQRCPVLGRCGNKVQSIQSLGLLCCGKLCFPTGQESFAHLLPFTGGKVF